MKWTCAVLLAGLLGAMPAVAEDVRGALVRYRQARAAPPGIVVPPAWLAERLARGDRLQVIDARAPTAQRTPMKGAMVRPLAALRDAPADLGPDLKVIVADRLEEAVEVVVLLRLAGHRAVALDGSLEEVHAAQGTTAPGADETARGAADPVASTRATTAPDPPPAAPFVSPSVLKAIGTGLLALAGVFAYFLVLLPRRRRRPLIEALQILERGHPAELPRAAKLLATALSAGLAPADVAEARFALAFVRARLDQPGEALSLLTELSPDESRNREVLYLKLWLLGRLKKHEEAANLYDEAAMLLHEFLQSREIAGIAVLEQARACMARRDTDRALHHFNRLRRLGVFLEEVPGDIQDHQIALGVEALYEDDPVQARRRFADARDAAKGEKRATTPAELGLLLCDWREAEVPDVDEALGRLAVRLTQAAPDAGPAAADGLTEGQRLQRNVRLWHAVSLLFTWLKLPAKQGLSAERRRELSVRLELVRALDSGLADPDLIEGLIAYYFGGDAEARVAAVATLDRALGGGVNVPEVKLLVDREQKLAESAQRSLAAYLQVLKSYLEDSGVPLALRRSVRERLSRYSRFRDLLELDLEEGADAAAPSLRDLQSRTEINQRRVDAILRSPQARQAAGTSLGQLVQSLKQATEALGSKAQEVEDVEHQLLAVTGEFLLAEEEGAP